MAKLYPSIEKIRKSKQAPTSGENFLLDRLPKTLSDESEIYFQPYFNGQRPDFVISNKDQGIIIIEVKDWNLDNYYLNTKNQWFLRHNDAEVLSPYIQASTYRRRMFDLHIDDLLESKIKNRNINRVVTSFVYFHGQTTESLKSFYTPYIEYFRKQIRYLDLRYSTEKFNPEQYNLERDRLKNTLQQIEQNLYLNSIADNSIEKINFSLSKGTKIFSNGIYRSFLRYLKPPFHLKHEGRYLAYSNAQKKLIESDSNSRQKIKGVAGSGKTSILAQRAVNAHKRHGNRVLILSFNITLKMCIKDKISAVREDFSWGFFDISNYHQFIMSALNYSGIKVSIPQGSEEEKTKILEKEYFSNESIFEGKKVAEIYDTILVDEIQDYKPEWIKILRKFFLSDSGEMVLFGDEKQNIYDRDIDDDGTTKIVQGFGRWHRLSRSYRLKSDTPVSRLAQDFKDEFLAKRYEKDEPTMTQQELSGIGLSQCINYRPDDMLSVAGRILSFAKSENIHPNDIVILSSQIGQMQNIDYLIRNEFDVKEQTLTTFESFEQSEKILKEDIKGIRRAKKTGFNLNSGVMKISTIHSFKGYEAPTVFLIVNDNDTAELLYVGITRAIVNLVVFIKEGSRYEQFFGSRLGLSRLED